MKPPLFLVAFVIALTFFVGIVVLSLLQYAIQHEFPVLLNLYADSLLTAGAVDLLYTRYAKRALPQPRPA